MRVVAIVQARMGSTRLPGKVLLPDWEGRPLLAVLLTRLSRSARLTDVVVATTRGAADAAIVGVAQAAGVQVWRGASEDVLERYYTAAQWLGLGWEDVVVRVTADCPLVDPEVVDRVVDVLVRTRSDFVYTSPSHYPDGLDTEALTGRVLWWLQQHVPTDAAALREHVTLALHDGADVLRRVERLTLAALWRHVRLTVDYPQDYLVVSEVLRRLGVGATTAELLTLYESTPAIWAPVRGLARMEAVAYQRDVRPSSVAMQVDSESESESESEAASGGAMAIQALPGCVVG